MRLEYETVAEIGRSTMGSLRYSLMRVIVGRRRWHQFLRQHNKVLIAELEKEKTMRYR